MLQLEKSSASFNRTVCFQSKRATSRCRWKNIIDEFFEMTTTTTCPLGTRVVTPSYGMMEITTTFLGASQDVADDIPLWRRDVVTCLSIIVFSFSFCEKHWQHLMQRIRLVGRARILLFLSFHIVSILLRGEGVVVRGPALLQVPNETLLGEKGRDDVTLHLVPASNSPRRITTTTPATGYLSLPCWPPLLLHAGERIKERERGKKKKRTPKCVTIFEHVNQTKKNQRKERAK